MRILFLKYHFLFIFLFMIIKKYLLNRYRNQMHYEMAMEGLQDLPIYNGKSIHVEMPDNKWPGFPQRVSAISSMDLSLSSSLS